MASWKDSSIWFQILLFVLGGMIGAYVNKLWIYLKMFAVAIIGLIVSYLWKKRSKSEPDEAEVNGEAVIDIPSNFNISATGARRRPYIQYATREITNTESQSHKHQLFLSAKKLKIYMSRDETCWTWTTSDSPRSQEVAKLLRVWYLDIRGSINKSELQLKSTYTAWFIFKLEPDRCGLETPFEATIQKIRGDKIIQSENIREVSLESGQLITDDGWLELPFGDFSTEDDDNFVSVKVRLHALEEYELKKGLIVDGIEFRLVDKDRNM